MKIVLILCFIFAIKISIYGTLAIYCEDYSLWEKIVGNTIDCEECDEKGNCLGKPQTIANHCLGCFDCGPGFSRDKNGRCRKIIKRRSRH